MSTNPAFGAPGMAPTWASSDKDCVTTSLGPARLWATVGHGVVNEVYWPSTGEPQLRDLTFYLVGDAGWIDLKRVKRYTLSTPSPHVPLPTLVHSGDDYRLALEIVPDPLRDVLLVRFELTGAYRLVVMAAPHLAGTGYDNTAWTQDDALFAQHRGHALCLQADCGLSQCSAGYVGASDGWQDLRAHGRLTWNFDHAGPGAVALCAQANAASGVLALGLADTPTGAATLARASLATGFDDARARFTQHWAHWGERLDLPDASPELTELARQSAAVLRIHEDRTYPGALVASLSTPWGNHTDTLGGYHLVWPRDATLSAFALIAAGQIEDARRILARFVATQTPDGHWSQNAYPSGAPFWTGVQLDETAFPVLLAAKLRECCPPEAGTAELAGTRDMVRRALGFVARTGPTSDQDRWEENAGVNPFTLAVAIAALIAGAPWLDDAERDYALALADEWNERVEEWCYVVGTPLAAQHGVPGYYVRLSPRIRDGGLSGQVQLRNREGETLQAAALVSLDFSYLVRLGLRDAADVRIRDTLHVVDRVLRVSTPAGDLYHRYNEDGYGEHANGDPFDGEGIGRAWPLLTGERGHLALLAGEDPAPYLDAMRRCASSGGLLPEQVWDSDALPERGLYPGRPSGSAMPLLWSHAEFLKLLVASHSRRPVELLGCVASHIDQCPGARAWHWRNETPVPELRRGRALSIQSRQPFALHYGWDGWQDVTERVAEQQAFGLWAVYFALDELSGHVALNFTRRFGDAWEGANHDIALHCTDARTLRHACP